MTGTAGIVFAAGKGSRMTGYGGNKTLLPLLAGDSLFEGSRPLIGEVLDNLPPGPKGIVVNHCADEVRKATEGPGISFILQPETNGTGGALLAARDFIRSIDTDRVIITMGDVPLILASTYRKLLEMLGAFDLALLAFKPEDRAQYGMLEMEGERVARIVEWKYWSKFPPEKQEKLTYCNAGVYAAGREVLLRYLERLALRPHEVRKERGGQMVTIREYFLTDLVEMMHADGLSTGMALASEEEVRGVDTPESLKEVQKAYALRSAEKEG